FSATDLLSYVSRGGSSSNNCHCQMAVTETLTGITLAASNLTVGSPSLGTPVYARATINFVATFPGSAGPVLGVPAITQKQILGPAASLTVGRPVIAVPGLIGFQAVSLVVGRPEIGLIPPAFSHPYGPHEQIPTLSQQIQEADEILERALDALVA